MFGLRSIFAALLVGLSFVSTGAANEQASKPILLEGAHPGFWTMDFDAAKQYAARKKMPLLLNFTGSDWCGWCKVMDESVFNKKAWTGFAATHVVLVTIDFPRGKQIVPEKWKERNSQLKKHFDVRGYPTYVIVAPDGRTKLGHLVANRGKTPESFIEDFLRILRKTAQKG